MRFVVIADRKQMMRLKTYSELLELETFEDRYTYLRLDGNVGVETFGFDRYMNQQFYKSREWKQLRSYIIVRDNGCDLGVLGHEIHGRILIHHMNPITQKDIMHGTEQLMNPEYLISVSLDTHNAIHYSDESLLNTLPKAREKNDTCPWRH